VKIPTTELAPVEVAVMLEIVFLSILAFPVMALKSIAFSWYAPVVMVKAVLPQLDDLPPK